MSAPSSRKSRLGPKLALIALALALAGAAAFYLTRPVAQVVLVRRGKALQARPGSVTINPAYSTPLTSAVGGYVLESALEEGGHVKEGDFLVQLDPADIDLSIEKLKIDRDAWQKKMKVGSQIELRLETAQAALDNDERLYKMGQVSQSAIDDERRSVKTIEQQVENEKIDNESQLETYDNSIKVAELQKKRMTILAPNDGVIKNVVAHKGALVQPQSPVADLISDSRTVEALVSEEDFGGIDGSKHQHASVRFTSYGPQEYGASVDRVLPTADPTTQRYVVYLKVDLPQEKLTPGLTGEVSIQVGEHDNVLIVPRRALTGGQLYVVNGGVVELRKVKQGYVSLTDVEITDGVREGEAVIAQDLDQFAPGDHVRTEVLDK